MQTIETPVQIDDAALLGLAREGHRWLSGRAGLVRYRWLLPPDFVLAGHLPEAPPHGIVHLAGGGDRPGRLTAVLGFLRRSDASPRVLVSRGAGPGVSVLSFNSRTAEVAERREVRDGKLVVTTVHACTAGGEAYRFFAAAVGQIENEQELRTIACGLSLRDESNTHGLGRISV